MTNTKFRKRALLSSVAMLLVALVALGSATFAWYAANTTVTASGLTMKSAASVGLLINSESGYAKGLAFDKTTTLDVNTVTDGAVTATGESFNLQPATFDVTADPFAMTWGSYTATGSGTSALKTGTWSSGITPATYARTSGGSVYSEKIYIKVSDGVASDATAKVKSAKVEFTLAGSSAIKHCVRVALVATQGAIGDPEDDGYIAPSTTLLGIWAPATAQDASGNAFSYLDDEDDETDDPTFVRGQNGVDCTSIMKASNAEYVNNSGFLTVSTALTSNYVTAYVYIDGYDKQCFSDNVDANMADILSSITVTFEKV